MQARTTGEIRGGKTTKNNEILDLVEENELEDEIWLADEFKAKLHRAITDAPQIQWKLNKL